jgi:hypothetical protein
MGQQRSRANRKTQLENIYRLFPEIMEIQETSLRDKVAKVWLSAARASAFRIEGAPNLPSHGYPAPGHSHPEMTRYKLIDHTRLVVLLSKDIAKRLREIFELEVNLDILLASAIIHDADKMVFYAPKGQEVVISDLGKKIPHGFFATKWAVDNKLPLDVVNAVFSHSGRASIFPKTLEGLIVLYADLIAADALRIVNGAKGILETYKHFGPAHLTHP